MPRPHRPVVPIYQHADTVTVIMPPPRRGGALSGHRRPSVCLMSRASALTRKPKGLGRRNFAQGYPRSHATPTPTSRSKVKSQGHGARAYCGSHLAAQLVSSAITERAKVHTTWVWESRVQRVKCKHMNTNVTSSMSLSLNQ